MEQKLKQMIDKDKFATVYINNVPYSVMDGDLKEDGFTAMDEMGLDHVFNYDEIGRVE